MKKASVKMTAAVAGLYPVIDAAYTAFEDMGKTARAIISGGARIIQLRAKDVPAGRMLEAARLLREITQERGVIFIVNDRIDVALMSRADGVHLGQDDVPVSEARALMGKDAIIGISTHDPQEAGAAERNGADYVSFGPVFPTKSKKDAHSPRGLASLSELRGHVSLPVVAIGGITGENAIDALRHGADSVAMLSEILAARDIKEKTAEITASIGSYMKEKALNRP